MKQLLRELDPRRSLVASITWLVIGLATTFAVIASLWVGRVSHDIVVQQHVRRLELEADQLGSDLGQAIAVRREALRAAAVAGSAQDIYQHLRSAHPDLDWLFAADETGRRLGQGAAPDGASAITAPWFIQGLRGPWIGVTRPERHEPGSRRPMGDLALPMLDIQGHTVGVIVTRLDWRWASRDIERLSDSLNPHGSAQTLILDQTDRVLVGPASLLDRRWNGVAVAAALPDAAANRPQFQRLPDGALMVVARAPIARLSDSDQPGWQVQLSEPERQVYLRADALRSQILWISIGLGAATALVGALAARHLTDRLKRLTRSVSAVGRGEAEHIEVPSGRDEVSALANVFAKLLGDLQRERAELLSLSSELERRVAVRTLEVERLAEESRYAAIGRERLKIARDLHDTLAHSMMAMLSEVRLLRKIARHDPASLSEELRRAEEVAHAGLNEARSAIAQMRFNAVRDTGLGAALGKVFDRFIDRTGLAGELHADPDAARFGDERAETLMRMAEECLRNIERHARASRVDVTLRTVDGEIELMVGDDGVGFDAAAPQPGHYGLVGLKEQARLIGARLDIDSRLNGGGTRIRMALRVAPAVL